MTERLDDISHTLEQIINTDSKILAQGQENNRALANLCSAVSSAWSGAWCSPASRTDALNMMWIVGWAILVVLVLQMGKGRW